MSLRPCFLSISFFSVELTATARWKGKVLSEPELHHSFFGPLSLAFASPLAPPVLLSPVSLSLFACPLSRSPLLIASALAVAVLFLLLPVWVLPYYARLFVCSLFLCVSRFVYFIWRLVVSPLGLSFSLFFFYMFSSSRVAHSYSVRRCAPFACFSLFLSSFPLLHIRDGIPSLCFPPWLCRISFFGASLPPPSPMHSLSQYALSLLPSS